MLTWTIYISFLGGLFVWMLGQRPALVRLVSLVTAAVTLVIALVGATQLDPGQINTLARHTWIPSLGISYHLAADGVSATLVILTGLAAVAGVLFSWNIEKRVNEFFALYLALIGGVFGVFLSFDL